MRRVPATGALVFGRSELFPGAEVAVSVMLPIPTEWWFRPLSMAARVGAQSAVVWTRVYFRAPRGLRGGAGVRGGGGCVGARFSVAPPGARRWVWGVAHGPPNALAAPNPVSS